MTTESPAALGHDTSSATVARVAWVGYGYRLALAIVLAWLAASVYLVNIDFDDGYTTIINSKYLLDTAPVYYWQRGPMLAMLLVPGEWLARALELPAFDVRSHHALMVVLHFIYLIGTWRLLKQCHGEKPSTLLAFLAAMFTVVFFSYAPFISHDIFPGVIMLLMIKLAVDYWKRPDWREWFVLVVLGAVLALVKQTYALVWVMLLLALCLVYVFGDRCGIPGRGKLVRLAGAAALSALITWIVYGYFLESVLATTPLLLRPFVQISTISDMYAAEGGARVVFYQWLYLRNLSAYGLLAMALIIPGIILSLRQANRLLQVSAIVWLLLITALQFTPFKEVRYLAFMAPLTALLIVPAIEWAWRRHVLSRIALVLVLALQLAGAGAEALRINAPYYRSAALDFLRPLPTGTELPGKFVFAMSLSFVSPESYAFFADRYHRITHISGDHIRFFQGYREEQYERLNTFKNYDARHLPVGSVILFTNDFAVRSPPFRADNQTSLGNNNIQLLGVAESVKLQRDGDFYRFASADSAPLFFLPVPPSDGVPVLATAEIPVEKLLALTGHTDAPEEMQLIAFRVRSFCMAEKCQYHGR
jgi:hypothetical protein